MRRYIVRVVFWTVLVVAFAMIMWRPILRILLPNPYAHTVNDVTREQDIDPLFVVAIMRTESGFDARAVSPKGARGLMQLMPETAIWAAEQMNIEFDVAQIDDPAMNVRIAVWYIRHLIEAFESNMPPVIAAYNAGPGNVRRWLDEGTWAGTLATIDSIPFLETRQYVRKVTDGYRLYRLLHRSSHAGYELSFTRGDQPHFLELSKIR